MNIQKDNEMYMRIALITAERSYARRLKVGCVIVKNHSIISFGWNGMPTGYDNCCEMEVNGELVTRPEVQHARVLLEGRLDLHHAQPLHSLRASHSEVRNHRRLLSRALPLRGRSRIPAPRRHRRTSALTSPNPAKARSANDGTGFFVFLTPSFLRQTPLFACTRSDPIGKEP